MLLKNSIQSHTGGLYLTCPYYKVDLLLALNFKLPAPLDVINKL